MTARKHCLTCNRGAQFVDGCSHIECPQRKLVTAQAVGTGFSTQMKGVEFATVGCGGLRREPTTKGDA